MDYNWGYDGEKFCQKTCVVWSKDSPVMSRLHLGDMVFMVIFSITSGYIRGRCCQLSKGNHFDSWVTGVSLLSSA